jgi:hypothetical protein
MMLIVTLLVGLVLTEELSHATIEARFPVDRVQTIKLSPAGIRSVELFRIKNGISSRKMILD